MKAIARAAILVTTAALALLLGGCPAWTDWINQNSVPAGLVRLESADALLAYFQEQLALSTPDSTNNYGRMITPQPSKLSAAGAAASDAFKSDGEYFYLVAGGRTLRVIDATPLSELAEVGRVSLDQAMSGVYRFGTKALVMTGGDGGGDVWVRYSSGATTTICEVDVADPAHPAITAQVELDGQFVTSQLVNGHLVLVLTIALTLPADVADVSQVTLAQLLPTMDRGAGDEPLVAPENWYRPLAADGGFATVVVTLDANNITTVLGSVAVMGRAGALYCTPEAVYLADSDLTLAREPRPQTTLHKLRFNATDVAVPAASGSVPGRPLGWHFLDEDGSQLRAATSVIDKAADAAKDDRATVDSDSGLDLQHAVVSVLTQRGGQLEVIGQIDNIAPSETTLTARFVGNRGILAFPTSTGPRFMLDLSDPTAPRIAGETTNVGLGEFLYPLDDTHILGLAAWTVPTEAEPTPCEGAHLVLFDVTDWSSPQAQQRIQCGGCGSRYRSAPVDPAFFILDDPTRIALPMFLTSAGTKAATSPYYIPDFRGALAFRVDPATGMAELARVEAPGTTAAAPWGLPLVVLHIF